MTNKDLRSSFTKARNKRGLSLRDVDAIIGVPYSTLARFERGENTPLIEIQDRIEGFINGDTDKKDRFKRQSSVEARLKRIEEHLGLN